jgi:hypothetical protein
MKTMLAIVMAILTVALLAAGSVRSSGGKKDSTPEAAVQALYGGVKSRDFAAAYSYVSPSSNVDQQTFTRDLAGKDGSLKTYSSLQQVDTRVLHENDNEGLVRATTRWSSAVGPLTDVRDLKVVNENGDWRVVWPVQKQPNLPPQVIPVNYLRWDVIHRGADEDWGAQDVAPPNVRAISMNAQEKDLGNGRRGVVIMGEVANLDVVPGFVTINAVLYDKKGQAIAQETSFDEMSHTLLPKEVSPYRIDFPGVKLSQIQKVDIQPNALLVGASADPVIGVLHQRIEKDSRAHKVLRGELINQSGQTVNIPHVIATFYDEQGQVAWVNDAYVDHALQPQIPEPFQLEVRDDIPSNKYRITVNQYSLDRPGI